jgi:hypothetical protein
MVFTSLPNDTVNLKKRRGSGGILEDAKKKAREILPEGLPLDSFKVERDKILSDAQEEVKHRIEESRKASAGMPISFFRKGKTNSPE